MNRYIKGPYKIYKTPEYTEWLEQETFKSQAQIDQRISNILSYGHFGDFQDVGNNISELRWANGRRLYYTYIAELDIVLLLGGNKNGQDKDIKQAKNIIKKYLKARDETQHTT